MRVGRSYLNEHSFSIGLSESPECLCHHPRESPKHIFLQCFLYNVERQTLFDRVLRILPKYKTFSETKKLDVLLNGIHPENPDFYYSNKQVQYAAQQFLMSTKRFDKQKK